MSAHYELKSAAGNQFMFNLKAANGEIILTSESYKAKEGALNGIEDCFTSAGNAGNGWARRTIASVSASSAE